MLYTGRVETKKGALHVRSAPGGAVIASLPKGSTVEVLSDEGAWAEIAFDGGRGYAAKQYIVFSEARTEARLIAVDEAGNAFAPEGGITVRIAAGAID